jgi:DNA-binding MarR family transcriptional regulator
MSPTNIEPGPATTRLALVVMRLSRTMGRLDTGLTVPQYNILAAVSVGGERSARLADKLAVAKPTLTAAADGLVEMGYLAREAEPGDRRVVLLHVTPAGREALTRADAVYGEWFTDLLELTGEPAAVTDALGMLNGAMSELHRRRHPEHAKGTV